jgi:hypothetical protein
MFAENKNTLITIEELSHAIKLDRASIKSLETAPE